MGLLVLVSISPFPELQPHPFLYSLIKIYKTKKEAHNGEVKNGHLGIMNP